jgi:hypothetical protein
MSLSDVAKKNREPDFFEVLQAGILAGSLGKGGARGDVLTSGLGYSASTFIDPDTKSTLQTLRIGANIIDQWDADNYPTTISLPATGDSVYGIEDLPYLNKFLYTVSGPGNVVTPFNQIYKFFAAFQLWNPNQAISSNAGAYPAGIQISPLNVPTSPDLSDSYQMGLVIKNGTSYPTWYWSGKNQAWTTGAYADYFGDLDSKGIINVPFTAPLTDYREPTASAALELKSMTGIPPDTVPKGALIASQLISASPRPDTWIYFKTSTVYRIQFLDQSGVYRTYGTFVGLDNVAAPVPGTGYRQSPWLKFSNTTTQKWYSAPKSDPRSFRFGSGQSEDYDVTAPSSSIAPGGSLVNTSRVHSLFPFTGGSSTTNPYRIDKWASNVLGGSTSTPANPSYPDKDGQIRPGDAYYSTVSPLNSSANGGVPLRPVILNRPFRSVGELGYVFRDMPWKTLDMFSARSPDAALLDVFSLKGSQSVLAGRVNPNTRQKEVLAVIIAETLQKVGGSTTVSSANAAEIGKAIVDLSKQAPFANRSELVTRLMDDPAIASISNIKTEREAVVRALADGANTRTWNLLIDLIAQVGRYPDSATGLDQFIVEGERHCWLHVAIDRFTGEIVDQQIEVVAE